MQVKRFLYIFCISVLVMACNETRNLEPGQYLYDGSTIAINATPKIKKSKRKQLISELDDLLRPKPNSKILGIRFKLWAYNIAGHPTGKGLRYWLKNKVGEAPVIGTMPSFEKNRAVLQNRLENRGYFHDTVSLDTTSKSRKIRAHYTATIGARYTIRKLSFPGDSTALSLEITNDAKNSLLKVGDPYDLDVVKNERSRIENQLQQKGYYYFNPDYLLAIVDSTAGNHQIDVRIVVKKSTPLKAEQIYFISQILVYADYDIHADSSKTAYNRLNPEGYLIIDPHQKFRPSIFRQSLASKPGDLYNRKDQDLSLNRLISLGVFKFVKLRFEETDTAKNKLNAFYYLTPTEKKSIRFEASGLTKSDNANGGLLSVNWRNRNIFRGAELFTASVYGGIEGQYLGNGQSISINKIGADLNLFIPRIMSPFTFHTNGGYVPKTRFELSYEFYDRTTQYQLSSSKASYGYLWKGSTIVEHQLNVATVNYVNPTNISPDFQQQLDTNLTLARSIERQFIIGPNYNFNVNTQIKPNTRPNNFYFNANLDLSGNLLGIISGANISKGNVKEIFHTPYSQYVRAEIDFRHYLSFSKNTVLVSRITGGVGYAYGNSNVMPFIKEFFAGGANDLRAFRSRSLGPGTFYAGNRDSAFLPDQPGDVKLEMNAELRFKLFSVFRWAFFADGGNIWTVRNDSARPGSVFTGKFLQQAALGVGTGLRVDISILILRLDVGIPVREPYRPEGTQWYFDSRNLVFNFAIGYPF